MLTKRVTSVFPEDDMLIDVEQIPSPFTESKYPQWASYIQNTIKLSTRSYMSQVVFFYRCTNRNVETYSLKHALYLSHPPSRGVGPEGKCKGNDVPVNNVKSYGK